MSVCRVARWARQALGASCSASTVRAARLHARKAHAGSCLSRDDRSPPTSRRRSTTPTSSLSSSPSIVQPGTPWRPTRARTCRSPATDEEPRRMRAGIALLPGDGIGPEVIDSAVTILTKLARLAGHTLSRRRSRSAVRPFAPVDDPWLTTPSTAASLPTPVLLGAVGDPQFDHLPPSSRPESALLRLRRELGAYANLRPARVTPVSRPRAR